MNQPIVTVILYVRGDGEGLHHALECLIGQTLSNIEILCVGSGWMDASNGIVKAYAEQDGRIKVIELADPGVWAAINAGVNHSTGRYFICLKSEDFFESSLCERACRQLEACAADICICASDGVYSETESQAADGGMLALSLLPVACRDATVFSCDTAPESVFEIAGSDCWNKLYRKDFANSLTIGCEAFQHYGGLVFYYLAMLKAKRIAYIEERLVHHQLSTSGNRETHDKDRPGYVNAMLFVDGAIREDTHYLAVRDSFFRSLSAEIVRNIHAVKNPRYFDEVYLSTQLLIIESGLNMAPASVIGNKEWKRLLTDVNSKTPYEFLLSNYDAQRRKCVSLSHELEDLRKEAKRLSKTIGKLKEKTEKEASTRRELQAKVRDLRARLRGLKRDNTELKREIKELEASINAIRRSHAFKLGRAMLRPLSALKKLMRKKG